MPHSGLQQYAIGFRITGTGGYLELQFAGRFVTTRREEAILQLRPSTYNHWHKLPVSYRINSAAGIDIMPLNFTPFHLDDAGMNFYSSDINRLQYQNQPRVLVHDRRASSRRARLMLVGGILLGVLTSVTVEALLGVVQSWESRRLSRCS